MDDAQDVIQFLLTGIKRKRKLKKLPDAPPLRIAIEPAQP